MAATRRRDRPIPAHFHAAFGFFLRSRMFGPEQFLACLRPIAVGKFIRVALVDGRDLARPPLDVFRRRHAHAVPV